VRGGEERERAREREREREKRSGAMQEQDKIERVAECLLESGKYDQCGKSQVEQTREIASANVSLQESFIIIDLL